MSVYLRVTRTSESKRNSTIAHSGTTTAHTQTDHGISLGILSRSVGGVDATKQNKAAMAVRIMIPRMVTYSPSDSHFLRLAGVFCFPLNFCLPPLSLAFLIGLPSLGSPRYSAMISCTMPQMVLLCSSASARSVSTCLPVISMVTFVKLIRLRGVAIRSAPLSFIANG